MAAERSTLHLKEAAWCRALRAARTACRVDLRGVSGRFLTHEGWDTGALRLGEHLAACRTGKNQNSGYALYSPDNYL